MKQKIKKPSNIMRKAEIEISEFEHQSMLVSWANLSVGKYSELKLLFAINNGLRLTIGAAMKCKKSGTKKGVPDLFLPVPRKYFHGLFIEMKKIKGTTSKEQDEFIQCLIDNGYEAKVCYGFEEAKNVIEEYLS